jgi:hypothetical protein
MELTLDQEFDLISFEEKVKTLTEEQTKALLVDYYRLMIEKDSLYKHLLATQWGLR